MTLTWRPVYVAGPRMQFGLVIDLRAWLIGVEVKPRRHRDDPHGERHEVMFSIGPAHFFAAWPR